MENAKCKKKEKNVKKMKQNKKKLRKKST